MNKESARYEIPNTKYDIRYTYMSGHSKWSQIKHKKGIADVKRGAVFSKLLKNISIAARTNANPDANPVLRAAIEKAKEANVPKENIERALARGDRSKGDLSSYVFEAYGPGGAALLIEVSTDNKNRTMMEVRKILESRGARLAEPGSARWAFKEENGWFAVGTAQPVQESDRTLIEALEAALETHDDVERVISNASV
jgi:YebC/PmpR family DNA-binding regulatory protein